MRITNIGLLAFFSLCVFGLDTEAFATAGQPKLSSAGAALKPSESRALLKALSYADLHGHTSLTSGCSNRATSTNCPAFIGSLVEDDRSGRSFRLFANPYDKCSEYQNFRDSAQKETFSNRSEFLKSIANEKFSSLSGGHLTRLNACLTNEPSFDEEQIAKYYYFLSRLANSQSSAIDEMATIDLTLGNQPISNVDCRKLPFERTQKLCSKVKTDCNSGVSLEELAKTTQDELSRLINVEAEILSAEKEYHLGRQNSKEASEKLRSQIISLKLEAQQIRTRNPLSQGKIFLAEKSKGIAWALRKQLEHNRQELSEIITKSTAIEKCFGGSAQGQDCSLDNVEKFIQDKTVDFSFKTQRLPSNSNAEEKSKFRRLQRIDAHLGMQQCLTQSRFEQKEVESLVWQAAFDIGLTVATAGAGSLAVTKMAIQTSRAAKNVTLAKNLSIGADYLNFGSGVQKAASECTSSLKFQPVDNKKTTNEKGDSCPLASPTQNRALIEDVDSCVLSTTMAAFGLAPFVGALAARKSTTNGLNRVEDILLNRGASKEDLAAEIASLKRGEPLPAGNPGVISKNGSLDDSQRIQQIKKDFPDLTNQQAICVVKEVHTIAGDKTVGTHLPSEIIQKGIHLRNACKISREDSLALIQLGYAGASKPIGEGVEEASHALARAVRREASRDPFAESSGKTALQSAVQELRATFRLKADPSQSVKALTESQVKLRDSLAKNPVLVQRLLDETVDPTILAGKTTRASMVLTKEKAAQLAGRFGNTSEMNTVVSVGDRVPFTTSIGQRGIGVVTGFNGDRVIVSFVKADGRSTEIQFNQMGLSLTSLEKADFLARTLDSTDPSASSNALQLLLRLLESPQRP